MASIFRSFGSSNMSKRLLRYALSRVELLDTDALDVDKLDLEWGKNNTFTFQDVGIKLQKLAEYLQLPPSFELQKAKVLRLRLTVPSTIYSSPIKIEVDGVQIQLKVASEDDTKRPSSRRGRTNPVDDANEILPDPMHLAQSFLETEPQIDKAKLQADLAAETQDLAASIASTSEEGSDEDLPMGTGQPLSVPVFLADFIQGIVDRIQVSITDVTFQLDIAVPVELHSTTPELVTFQLAIDDIKVEGVTAQAPAGEDTDSSAPVLKEGKRRIALNKVRAALISEANVFSTLARTPSMPSSVRTTSPVMTERKPPSRASTSMSASIHDSPLARSEDLSQSLYQPLMDSEDAFNIPYELGSSNDESEDEIVKSNPSTPRALAPRDSPVEPAFRPAQSVMGTAPDAWSSFEREARSEPTLEQLDRWGHDDPLPRPSAAGPSDSTTGNSRASSSEPEEDLAKSHLFSHEEAESMYMSAFSRTARPMPGSWDSEPSSYGGSPRTSRNRTNTAEVSDSPESDPEAFLNPRDTENGGRSSSPGPTSSTAAHREGPPSLSGDFPSNPEEPFADGIATPRGPTRLVKEILSLDCIAIYVPSTHKHISLPTNPETMDSPSSARLDRSMAPNLPGAFSVHEGMRSDGSPPPQAQPPSPSAPAGISDDSIEIELDPLEIRFDASIGYLVAMVASRMFSLLKGPDDKAKPMPDSAKDKPASTPQIKLLARQVSIQFLEILVGVADTPERIFKSGAATFEAEVLLMTSLEGLSMNLSKTESATETSVRLQKFRFGYANDDIISFDSRLQMRASIRDAFPSSGADVSLNVIQTAEATRCEVKTLPLHLKLDLQRLDETFSWFGGLSSFLNMGSSVTSNNSPVPKSPTPAVKKPRGVRFDAPIRADDKSVASENKVNLRVGGFHLDLIGKECSVSVDTSAVKLVAREGGIGVGITKIQLAGPIFRRSMADPPIQAEVANTRIEFLPSPKDNDLERLLELITPSKYKFDEKDDEIMVDTLLRQRRKGAVLRLSFEEVDVKMSHMEQLQCLPALGEELARLGTVAKYLPEDDRPGILSLVAIRRFGLALDVNQRFGSVQASLTDLEVGHITLPSLVALGINSISIRRNDSEELIGLADSAPVSTNRGPVLTMRMIPDAMEPVIKLRMRYVKVEYRVPTIMDILDLAEDATPQDFEAQLSASVANLGAQAHTAITGKASFGETKKGKANAGKPTKVDLVMRDCLVGLNPLGLTSKLVVALTDAQLQVALSNGDDAKAVVHLNKASLLLIDDVTSLDAGSGSRRRTSNASTQQVLDMCSRGYVDICYISAAQATVLVGTNQVDGSKFIDVEVRDELLVLETCADSTQTMIALANALQPPTLPSKEAKYRTEVVPVQDLLASISADAFGKAEGAYDFDDDFGLAQELGGVDLEGFESQTSSQSSPLDVNSQYYDGGLGGDGDDEHAAAGASFMSERTTAQDTSDGVLLTNFNSQPSLIDDDDLVIHDNYFGTGSTVQGTAHRWNSAKNAYDESKNAQIRRSPVAARVRGVNFIWNLFDGYDWDRTRQVITQAVEDVEAKAVERRSRSDNPRITADMEAMIDEEETVIGDFLFNSIYIGVPANRDPRELAQTINQQLNDNATETESIATTALTATPSRVGSSTRTRRKLRLNRSKRHKITFELKGIDVDFVAFPEGSGETKSSVDVRIKDLDVFDHVPTSTWKKFATYDQDAGEREMGTSMAHLEILTVKPLAELAASEFVLKVSLLPLRLHVDQDALDFITRFFEFKDASVPTHASPADVPFVQRAEINSIPVKLDFKPKRVDYAGLRSGHTTEFMNFLVLDEARMTMRHTIVYGVSGFDRLGQMLNDIWMPDIKRNQLPGILAGLAPVRSLVNVGSGFKDLVEIPIKEYKKDGRIVRSLGKGAAAFAKTTGTEIVKLGAKVAVGTQYVLQGAEGMLGTQPEAREGNWEDDDFDTEETKQISLYADQPTGVMQGLRGAYSSLARDLHVARDAIIAVPGEVMESQNAQGVAKAVLRRAPTIIFRPLIGSSKAIGQTLLGATNSLDPHNRRRIDEKYKKH